MRTARARADRSGSGNVELSIDLTVCQIDGCDIRAEYTVVQPNNVDSRDVCPKCCDELVALYDYKLGPVPNPQWAGIPTD